MTRLLPKSTCEGDPTLPSTAAHPEEKHVAVLGATLTHKCFFKVLGWKRSNPSLTSGISPIPMDADLNQGVQFSGHLLRSAPALLHHHPLLLCHGSWLLSWNSMLAKAQGIWSRGQASRLHPYSSAQQMFVESRPCREL